MCTIGYMGVSAYYLDMCVYVTGTLKHVKSSVAQAGGICGGLAVVAQEANS